MRRIAVVGSGVAGLTAAYVASRTAEVTLFEADDRLGGHADTHDVPEATVDGGERTLRIDTGFIVHNPRTYPVLLRMFAELGVATQASEMSMSIKDDDSDLEWAGALGRAGLFPTSANLRKPRYLAMLAEIPLFHRRAKALLAEESDQRTLRQFLADGHFSAYFTRHFMEPVVACVWSCDPDVALDYPARYLFTFLNHHGMLGIFGSPQWRTVTNGSHSYVDKIAALLPDVRLGTKVTSVAETTDGGRDGQGGVEITDGSGNVSTFDAVVIAAHPSATLSMLADPTDLQRELLTAMPYEPNTALLHTDTSVMPRAENAWASWNFRRRSSEERAAATMSKVEQRPRVRDELATARDETSRHTSDTAVEEPGVLVTYDLTRLMRLDTDVHYLVTLGGDDVVDPATVIDRMEYEHPLYNPVSVAAQARLPEIDTDRVVLAGAYHGWGFHEDGARSGLAAVTRLGLPWPEAERSPHVPAVPTGVYDTEISHSRRAPLKNRFSLRSHTWVVDLDDLPDRGLLARFEARDHLGDPTLTIRANVVSYLARHDVEIGYGKVFMAAQARALGYCFNPISVFWCHDETGSLVATVVEVHNTYGDRHAYLVPAAEQDAAGHATTAKSMYVSPFHGTDGVYDLTVPVPDASGRLRIVVELQPDGAEHTTRFSAVLTGRRSDTTALRAAPAALRGSLLIRLHGIALWLRRLPVRERPQHTQEGVQD